jgi:hypothetical protein
MLKNYLTPNRLKKGPKANIVIGRDGDRFIGLEGASVNLLAHHSPYAKKKLLDEGATVLCIPDGPKQPIQWIYKYMQGAETDAQKQVAYESLSFDNLVSVYTHSAVLEYQSLKDRVAGHLKDKYNITLPTVKEMQTLQTSVRPVYEHVINILAHELANPWACNYTAYMDLTTTNEEFCENLEKAMKNLIDHRVSVGKKYYATTRDRQVLRSMRYYENVKNTKFEHLDADLPTATDGKFNNYSTIKKQRSGRTKGQKVTCYNCNEEGHIARHCSLPRKAKVSNHTGNNSPIRDTADRNRYFRHAQTNRFANRIDVAGNGEGLRTCDREVRKGEVTRTGLVI